MEKQSKKQTHMEVITNQILGLIIGWCLVFFVFPLIGIDATAQQATASSIMFFLASYARMYLVRRFFNRLKNDE